MTLTFFQTFILIESFVENLCPRLAPLRGAQLINSSGSDHRIILFVHTCIRVKQNLGGSKSITVNWCGVPRQTTTSRSDDELLDISETHMKNSSVVCMSVSTYDICTRTVQFTVPCDKDQRCEL